LPRAADRLFRLCARYAREDVCNWALSADDPTDRCRSCRLTRTAPDPSHPGRKGAWFRLEAAKRRLVYGLLALGLPVVSREEDAARGLAFDFLEDDGGEGAPPVLTGHANGVITVNVAEADDAERERRRVALREPYRTLLGHFRHESGHYYWDRLLRDSRRLAEFRERFGDERADYAAALKAHYDAPPAPGWPDRFISAYAAAHPWEDWAETWAHYLHMVDALETASSSGLSLRPRRSDEPTLVPAKEAAHGSFARMLDDWFALTYVLNNLNRGLGLPDGYPFVLSPVVADKLRFVHDAAAPAREQAA
jgi:hypothetical protein